MRRLQHPWVLAVLLYLPFLFAAPAVPDAQRFRLPPFHVQRLFWADAVQAPDAGEPIGSAPAASAFGTALAGAGAFAPLLLRLLGLAALAAAVALVPRVLEDRGASAAAARLAAWAFALHPSHAGSLLRDDGTPALLAVALGLAALAAARRPHPMAPVTAIACTICALYADRAAAALPLVMLVDASLFERSRRAFATALAALGVQAAASAAGGPWSAPAAPGAPAILEAVNAGASALSRLLWPWALATDGIPGVDPPGLGVQYAAALAAFALALALQSGRVFAWAGLAAALWYTAARLLAPGPWAVEPALSFPSLAVCAAVGEVSSRGLLGSRPARRAAALLVSLAAAASIWTLALRFVEAGTPCGLAAATLRRQPSALEPLWQDARCALIAGDFDRAEARAAGLAAASPRGSVLQAQARWGAARVEGSVAALADALRRGAAFAEPVRDAPLAALLALARGRPGDAFGWALRAAERAEAAPAAFELASRIAQAGGQAEQAVELARLRVARAPGDAAGRAWLAQLLFATGRLAEARAALREGTARAEPSAVMFAAAVEFELVRGDPDEAVAIAEEAWRRGVALDGAALLDALRSAARAQRLAHASPLIGKLRARDDRDAIAAALEARLLLERGEAGRADALLAELRRRHPRLPLRSLLADADRG
jgi:hypothetical protein